MLDTFDSTIKRIQNWSPTAKFFTQLGIAFFIILFAPTGGRLVGPLLILLFWFFATAENRTITISTIIAAASVGLVGFVPVTTILETPIVLIFGRGQLLTAVFSMALEMILILAVLVVLSFWPKSRLRYTAGIADFLVIGLSLGVGLECGIGILHASEVGSQGVAMGMLPQVPGLLGHPTLPVACSTPTVWGMSFGLLVGVSRYLIGPNFNTSWLRRGIVIAVALFLLFWHVGERVIYIMGEPTGFWGFLSWLDLKGRLLTYSIGLLSMITVLVEWLVLQQSTGLKNSLRAWKMAWQAGEKKSWFNRCMAVLRVWEKRGWLREKILAEEVKPTLSSQDIARMQQRLQKTENMLAKEGSQTE
jgi:hypothetical protein